MITELMVLSDYSSARSETGRIYDAFRMLTQKGGDRYKTHLAVQTITEELSYQLKKEVGSDDKLLLVPVLRAGIAMWVVMNREFHGPATHFCVGDKIKGSSKVVINWLKNPPKTTEVSIVVLDTVVATGDTVVCLLEELRKIGVLERNSLFLLSCYASPASVERIKSANILKKIMIGVLSEGVDNEGYLIPYTHGDIGDKLFSL